MPSHSARRRQRKELARIDAMSDLERRSEVMKRFERWDLELRSLAKKYGRNAARTFMEQPLLRETASHLDPSGKLLADLQRSLLDAEAEAEAFAWNRGH
jgi:hypothetical protein